MSDIIEFCMGRSSFNVPEGMIRDRVSWYAVIYKFGGEEVLIAKPAPEAGALSGSLAMVRRGAVVIAQKYDDLVVNDVDSGVESLLTGLLGIPANATDVSLESSRESFNANIKHTSYYLFQKQAIITNKDQLFYRQNEPFQPQAIKDTLPILLGISGKDKFMLESQLRNVQRDLRLNSKLLQHARDAKDSSAERALGLASEAREVGIVGSVGSAGTEIIPILRQALDWEPMAVLEDDGQRVTLIEDELSKLRGERREAQRKIDSAQQFARRADGFENEVLEQHGRLTSIKALPTNTATGEWQWPFAEANLGMTTPIAEALLTELKSLDRELTAVSGERPALEAYLVEQQKIVATLTDQIRTKEVELSSAISTSEILAQLGSRNNAASRVVGRISLFLENLVPDAELVKLNNEQRRLKARVAALENEIGADDSDARLQATLNNIATHMSGYIKDLGGEFSEFPARLDLKNLTVVIDRPSRPIYMNKTGGGANHLAYHLGALLALHRFSTAYDRPIPRFMMIDQPTQVYFPSEGSYQQADGSIEQTEKDADLEAVRRLFMLLHRFTVEDAPGFQLIVTEHANLRDEWFQAALVEKPWAKPPALVPEDWPELPFA